MKGPVTPNAYRKAKSLARQCQREYEIRRSLFLSTRSIFGHGNIIARESAIDHVLQARQDRDNARLYIRQLESRGTKLEQRGHQMGYAMCAQPTRPGNAVPGD